MPKPLITLTSTQLWQSENVKFHEFALDSWHYSSGDKLYGVANFEFSPDLDTINMRYLALCEKSATLPDRVQPYLKQITRFWNSSDPRSNTTYSRRQFINLYNQIVVTLGQDSEKIRVHHLGLYQLHKDFHRLPNLEYPEWMREEIGQLIDITTGQGSLEIFIQKLTQLIGEANVASLDRAFSQNLPGFLQAAVEGFYKGWVKDRSIQHAPMALISQEQSLYEDNVLKVRQDFSLKFSGTAGAVSISYQSIETLSLFGHPIARAMMDYTLEAQGFLMKNFQTDNPQLFLEYSATVKDILKLVKYAALSDVSLQSSEILRITDITDVILEDIPTHAFQVELTAIVRRCNTLGMFYSQLNKLLEQHSEFSDPLVRLLSKYGDGFIFSAEMIRNASDTTKLFLQQDIHHGKLFFHQTQSVNTINHKLFLALPSGEIECRNGNDLEILLRELQLSPKKIQAFSLEPYNLVRDMMISYYADLLLSLNADSPIYSLQIGTHSTTGVSMRFIVTSKRQLYVELSFTIDIMRHEKSVFEVDHPHLLAELTEAGLQVIGIKLKHRDRLFNPRMSDAEFESIVQAVMPQQDKENSAAPTHDNATFLNDYVLFAPTKIKLRHSLQQYLAPAEFPQQERHKICAINQALIRARNTRELHSIVLALFLDKGMPSAEFLTKYQKLLYQIAELEFSEEDHSNKVLIEALTIKAHTQRDTITALIPALGSSGINGVRIN